MRREAEAGAGAAAEKEKQEQAAAQAAKEKQELYARHMELARKYLSEDKFDPALAEYKKLLTDFPDDAPLQDGIRTAEKYLHACDEFVGRWYVEPNGIKWEVRKDKTMHGTWLVFSSDGFWECASARDREFVTRWPDCPVCNTDYFILSDDGNTLTGIRNSRALTGRRLPAPR